MDMYKWSKGVIFFLLYPDQQTKELRKSYTTYIHIGKKNFHQKIIQLSSIGAEKTMFFTVRLRQTGGH